MRCVSDSKSRGSMAGMVRTDGEVGKGDYYRMVQYLKGNGNE